MSCCLLPLDSLDVRAVLLMPLVVELRKIGNVLRVRLQYIRCLQTLDAVLVDVRDLVLEEQGVDAFVLIIRA